MCLLWGLLWTLFAFPYMHIYLYFEWSRLRATDSGVAVAVGRAATVAKTKEEPNPHRQRTKALPLGRSAQVGCSRCKMHAAAASRRCRRPIESKSKAKARQKQEQSIVKAKANWNRKPQRVRVEWNGVPLGPPADEAASWTADDCADFPKVKPQLQNNANKTTNTHTYCRPAVSYCHWTRELGPMCPWTSGPTGHLRPVFAEWMDLVRRRFGKVQRHPILRSWKLRDVLLYRDSSVGFFAVLSTLNLLT